MFQQYHRAPATHSEPDQSSLDASAVHTAVVASVANQPDSDVLPAVLTQENPDRLQLRKLNIPAKQKGKR